MPSLLITEGPLSGQRLPVDAEIVLGRVNADLTIDDPLVSRRHAYVRPSGDGLEIEDLGSLNGTWVNGERIDRSRRLAAGDVVKIGGTAIEIEIEVEAADEGGTVLAARPDQVSRGSATAPPRAKERGDAAVPAQEDELRPVSALFADIVGSTGLGERLAADEVKVVIGECVSRMTRLVEQFGGVVQAYMGDGIAAFFGIPTAHEDDAERAAHAALRILDELGEYGRAVEAAWGISDFNARIGINTGEAAVGLVGGSDPQSVSLGDTSNVAARLQALADPGSIVVGQATAQSLVQRFVLEPLGPVAVKGRQQPVGAWKLVGAQAAMRIAPQTPLIGRDEEVARFEAVLADLAAGRGQIAFLLGEAGLGKTRLLSELRAMAAERGTWVEGHCYSYGTDLLYGPFIQMLRGWLGVEEGEAELSVRTKLRAKLGLLPASQLPDVLPYLARLLSVTLEPADEERLRGLSPQELAAGIRRAYRAWLSSLAAQGPVIVAIEDVHWADPSSRELAEDLLELADLVPLLLVSTLRVDASSEGWRLRVRVLSDFPHRAVELRLTPLTDEASRELLAALPRSQEVDESELDLIIAGAEGNPLYLEELLNAFADNRPLRRGQTWAPTVTGRGILTPNLESLLLARLDRLPASARRLAQVAAVIGRSFPLRVLAHVGGSDDLEQDLASLLRADIIRELRRHPEPEYTFKHGLLRQACVSTLPPPRKRELYGSVGAAVELLFAGSIEDHLEVIAHYFGRSDDPGKALEYLTRAGERAAALDASQRAAELWRRALKVAEQLGDAEAARVLRERLDALGAASPRHEASA